jgi:hypothetical protein
VDNLCNCLSDLNPLRPQWRDSASQGANKILLGLIAQAGLGLIIRSNPNEKAQNSNRAFDIYSEGACISRKNHYSVTLKFGGWVFRHSPAIQYQRTR